MPSLEKSKKAPNKHHLTYKDYFPDLASVWWPFAQVLEVKPKKLLIQSVHYYIVQVCISTIKASQKEVTAEASRILSTVLFPCRQPNSLHFDLGFFLKPETFNGSVYFRN